MRILVTGSTGHLGEALIRTLQQTGHDVAGLDIKRSPFTRYLGSIVDRKFVRQCMAGVNAVFHTATLHKPHIGTHSRKDFIDTNITGTLNLLEEAGAAGVASFIFTSTTSTFGHALTPPASDPAAWVTEDLKPIPKNIYGMSKVAAEDLCELIHQNSGLPCLVLRTSRFFPEEDDNKTVFQTYNEANVKVNEFLYRRVDLEDVVEAHLLALDKAQAIGFGRFIISATTPFLPCDRLELRGSAPAVVKRLVPEYAEVYAQLGWKMFPDIERVYVNERARHELGWRPRFDFRHIVNVLKAGGEWRSPLARAVGSKGYHA